MTKKRGKKGKQQAKQEEETPAAPAAQAPQTQPAASASAPAAQRPPQQVPAPAPAPTPTPTPVQSVPAAIPSAQPPAGFGRGRGKGQGRGAPGPGVPGPQQVPPGPGRGAGPPPAAWGPRAQASASQPQQHVPPQQQQVPQQQAQPRGPGQQRGPPPQQQQRPQQPQQAPQQPSPQRQQAPQQRPQQPQQAPQQRPQQPQQAPQQPPPQRQQAPQQRPQQPQQAPQQRPQQPQQAPQQAAQQRPPQSQAAPQQLSPNAMRMTTEAVAKMKLIPCRKNPSKAGTQGRPITVEANVMSISFSKNFNPHAVHYDVTFDPDKPKFMLRRAYNVVHQKYFANRHPAFDGKKNLYSSGLLPFGEGMAAEVEVHDPERDQMRTYKVTISKVADVDLSWVPSIRPGMPAYDQTGLQVLDVVLRNGPASRCVQVGRSFFSPPKGRIVDLGNGLELWVGMFQSAIVGWKPFLNVDVAHKGFPKPINVVDFMYELAGNRDGPSGVDRMKSHIAKQLRGLKVIYEIPGHPTSKRTQRVNDLMNSAIRSVFKLDNGTETTVYDYFLRDKQYKIKHPDLPCVWVGGRNRNIYVPAELCTITPGQVTMKKMDEIQTSNMIKSAATNTDVRKQKIMDAFASINFNNDPCVREFGLSVGGGFEKVPARVLDPPTLMYDRQIKVSRGVWRASKFNKPAHLELNSWTILNVNGRYTRHDDLQRLAKELIKHGSTCGMNLGNALEPFTTMDPPTRDVRPIQQFLEKNKNLKLIVVVVPDRGSAYSKIKQAAEIQIGVLTQCIKARTLSRLSDATTCNILLKINSKLNGVNHMLMDNNLKPKCLMRPCIIIGADVTHPPPDATDMPSIAAVAASHDAKAQFMYNIKTQLQPPREEIILDLERMVREQLLIFYKKNGGQKPEKIIFYRDGVSEGQFGQVLSRELEAIKRACKTLQAGYQPPITFLVVQKRHHVRLFPTDSRNSDDRNGNVQAGTVVDTVITHPSHIDFYLVSHASIQGVARPTKYRCLWDDSNMSEDDIEQLTYYLCHMFSRCTRSVSYPAPTYYAHLAAYRARVHTEDLPMNILNLDEEQRKKLTLAEGIVQNPMYFV